MHYMKARKLDVANGPGIRCSIWLSGCTRHCPDCFNQSGWDFQAGKELTKESMIKFANIGRNKEIAGFSILGGEPLQQNKNEMLEFLDCLHQVYRKTIWMWTGYTYEELTQDQLEIVNQVDVLVDGPFIKELKNPNLRFRGSSNQRIIDVKATVKKGQLKLHNLFH